MIRTEYYLWNGKPQVSVFPLDLEINMERFGRYRSGDMPHFKVHRLWETMSRQG